MDNFSLLDPASEQEWVAWKASSACLSIFVRVIPPQTITLMLLGRSLLLPSYIMKKPPCVHTVYIIQGMQLPACCKDRAALCPWTVLFRAFWAMHLLTAPLKRNTVGVKYKALSSWKQWQLELVGRLSEAWSGLDAVWEHHPVLAFCSFLFYSC